MPIRIPNDLPAFKTLVEENIFVMSADRAMGQDIRPLKIAIVNLMPTKIETETQLLRLLSNTPLQVDITPRRIYAKILLKSISPIFTPPLMRLRTIISTRFSLQEHRWKSLPLKR